MDDRQTAAFFQRLLQPTVHTIHILERCFLAIDIQDGRTGTAGDDRRQDATLGHFDDQLGGFGGFGPVGLGRGGLRQRFRVILCHLDGENRRQSRIFRRRDPEFELRRLRAAFVAKGRYQRPTHAVAGIRAGDNSADKQQ